MKSGILLLGATVLGIFLSGCSINTRSDKQSESDNPKIFQTSFESVSDFSGFYIVPPDSYGSSHELSQENIHSGKSSHKAWITQSLAETNDGKSYTPHRAYPTIQFQKTKNGVLKKPVLITIWTYIDMELKDASKGSIDDWLSLITLTSDTTDAWRRTMLVNIGSDGYLRLMHVPTQGKQEYIYQAGIQNDPGGQHRFPKKTWNRIDMYIDFDKKNGYAKVWQNSILVSHAKIQDTGEQLAQAHFGLYASAAVASGSIYNDDLTIREVNNEQDALSFFSKK